MPSRKIRTGVELSLIMDHRGKMRLGRWYIGEEVKDAEGVLLYQAVTRNKHAIIAEECVIWHASAR